VVAAATASVVIRPSWARGGDGAAIPPTVVSNTACASGWVAPKSGLRNFTVENTSPSAIYGVDLVGANQLSIYGEIEMLAPGTEP
jgi:hypothetical protein